MQTQIMIFGWLVIATLLFLAVIYLHNMKKHKKSAFALGIAAGIATILPAVFFFINF